MYLQLFLTREDHEIIKKVYFAQQLKPCRNDWFLMISEIKLQYHIQFSDDKIAKMSKRKYKKLVNSSVEKYAHKSLLTTARTQSKCSDILDHLNSNKLQSQKYLSSNKFTKQEQQVIFALRTKSYPLKSYFSGQFKNDMICRICNNLNSREDFDHMVNCDVLKIYVNGPLRREDLFGDESKQLKFIHTFMPLHTARETIMEIMEK